MLLRGDNIRFQYGPRFSLNMASFTLGAREFVGIIGANGSGKTTALRILAGLLSPAEGTVWLDGQPIGQMAPSQRGRRLAYVPQFHRPVFEFTVEQSVLLGRIPHRHGLASMERPSDLEAARRAIDVMELQELRREPITHLSGGELQRTVLARALAQETSVLLLDEPNTHLDFGHQLHILDRLRHVSRQRDAGVVATIHDLNLAAILCDRIVLMIEGDVAGEGTPAEILRTDLLAGAFGADLEIERDAFGDAPAVRYRYDRTQRYR